jgi:hypothetical protein
VKEFHILSLGAGLQSTTLYLMFLRGDLTPQIDCAIFADTGEEPTPVYRHLEWLQSLNGPPILVRSVGKLGEDLKHGRNSTGQRFASIPVYTTDVPGLPKGMVRRQCTKEYKLEVIERTIRREVIGLQPRQWFPRGEIHIKQYIGISFDEAGRAGRVRLRFAEVPWATPVFPLIEREITRAMCQQRLRAFGVPHEVPRSACVFCPYHSNEEWRWLRDNDPAGFQRAVEIDTALRTPGNLVNRNFDQKLYVHRSCVPLADAILENAESSRDQTFMGFYQECNGLCGN